MRGHGKNEKLHGLSDEVEFTGLTSPPCIRPLTEDPRSIPEDV